MKIIRAYDVFGNIAIVKFPREFKLGTHRSVYPKLWSEGAKKKFAEKILKDNNSVKTVLEKVGKFSGRLRKMQTKYLAGEKNKEVLYKENDCVFRFNIDTSYFSPRLSNERKEVASKIKKKDNVLVMFAGVAPFSIVIAKKSGAQVWSNEINREANKYAKLNIERNNLKSRVVLVPGDARKLGEKIKGQKFDIIVMPRPQLRDSFLDIAFKFSKKGTRIFYYGFCKEDEKDKILEQIKEEAKKSRKKIKILNSKKAGEIGPYKIRLRVEFRVL